MPTYIPATVSRRIDLTHDLAVFKIKPPQPFTFIPGQFARLGLELNGKLFQRAYSICSAPHEPELEFFVELVPDGRLTPSIWDLHEGDTIQLGEKAAGKFLLENVEGANNHLMLATVTGIAPFASMIRDYEHRLEQGASDTTNFLVIHGGSFDVELEHYMKELVHTARHNWLTYIPTVSRPWECPNWKGETGRVDELIRKYADSQGFTGANSFSYAVGHPSMIDNADGILKRAGFPKERIHKEQYFSIKNA